MADNVAITPGSGATVATDDVGGVQYQRVKLDLGGDGVSSPLLRGQQSKANSLPVALANDQDALTVDGNVAVTGTVDVNIVSGSSAGTEYTEDTAAAADPAGGALIARRRDALASETSADGDNTALNSTAKGELYVKHADSIAVTNATLESAVLAENAVHNSGDKGVMALGVRTDGGTVFAADGDYLPLSLNGSGALRVISLSGSAVGGPAAHDGAVSGNPVLLGGTASAAAPTSVSADGDAVRLWALRNGSLATTVTAAGALIGGDAANGLDVDVTRLPSLPAGSNNIGDVDVLTLPALPAGTNNIGDVDILTLPGSAHDVAISGNPVRVGGRALSADYTAVATGDTADLICDLNGKQIVMPYALPQNFVGGATSAITDTSNIQVIAAAGAGIRNYITQILVTNSHATVGTVVEIKDGTTVLYRGYAAPAGGGFSMTLPVPLKGTANTAINAANITTGSHVYVSASGFRAP